MKNRRFVFIMLTLLVASLACSTPVVREVVFQVGCDAGLYNCLDEEADYQECLEIPLAPIPDGMTLEEYCTDETGYEPPQEEPSTELEPLPGADGGIEIDPNSVGVGDGQPEIELPPADTAGEEPLEPLPDEPPSGVTLHFSNEIVALPAPFNETNWQFTENQLSLSFPSTGGAVGGSFSIRMIAIANGQFPNGEPICAGDLLVISGSLSGMYDPDTGNIAPDSQNSPASRYASELTNCGETLTGIVEGSWSAQFNSALQAIEGSIDDVGEFVAYPDS